MNIRLQIGLLLPALISVGYAVPFLPGGKRLRDLNYIKIFLIAISWALITVTLPAIDMHLLKNVPMILMTAERCCYIFALTIPFDIRDVVVDAENKVQTLPQKLGIKNAKNLAYGALVFMLLFTWLNYRINTYNIQHLLVISLSAIIGGTLIFFANKEKSDYYYTGVIDGMLMLQFPLLLLF